MSLKSTFLHLSCVRTIFSDTEVRLCFKKNTVFFCLELDLYRCERRAIEHTRVSVTEKRGSATQHRSG